MSALTYLRELAAEVNAALSRDASDQAADLHLAALGTTTAEWREILPDLAAMGWTPERAVELAELDARFDLLRIGRIQQQYGGVTFAEAAVNIQEAMDHLAEREATP